MFSKYIVPLLALGGLALAVFAVVRGNRQAPLETPVSAAPQSPYPTSVAGSGIVEAGTGNIAVGTPVAGIVAKIFVEAGSNVKAGDPLFAIDARAVQAQLAVRRAAVQVAEAQLADAKHEFALAESLAGLGLTTMEERERKRFAIQKAEAQAAQSQSELKSSEINLERLTIRAPVDGQVLQRRVRLGEYAATGVSAGHWRSCGLNPMSFPRDRLPATAPSAWIHA